MSNSINTKKSEMKSAYRGTFLLMCYDERLLKRSSLTLNSSNSINRQRFCPVMLERELRSKFNDEKSKLMFVKTSFHQKKIEMSLKRKNVCSTRRFLTVLKDLFFLWNYLPIRKRSQYHIKILMNLMEARVMKLMKWCHLNHKFNMFDLKNHNLSMKCLLNKLLQDHSKIHFNRMSWFLLRLCMQFSRCLNIFPKTRQTRIG